MLDPSLQPAVDILTKLIIFAIVIFVIEAYLHSKIDGWRSAQKKKKKNQEDNNK